LFGTYPRHTLHCICIILQILGTEIAGRLTLKGTESGDMVDFEGTALQLPGVTFKAVLTRICD
jgi:hypothetical protein